MGRDGREGGVRIGINDDGGATVVIVADVRFVFRAFRDVEDGAWDVVVDESAE